MALHGVSPVRGSDVPDCAKRVMFKLKRLKILQYRNVRPGTELRFDDGPNLILGQNASGKTTLLALLSVVCRSTFEDIADEEFALEYELRGDRFTVTAKVSHRRAGPSTIDRVFGAGSRWEDEYELELDDRESQTQTTIASSKPGVGATAAPGAVGRSVVVSPVDLSLEWSFIAAELVKLGGDWVGRGTELLRAFVNAYRFDESLDGFAAMTGEVVDRAAVPSAARVEVIEHHDAPGKLLVEDVFMPESVVAALHQGVRDGSRGQGALDLGEAGKGFSKRLARALEVEGVSIIPNLLEHRVTSSDRLLRVQGFTFEVSRAGGTTVHHDLLSYGQKRLLSFLYYLECNPSVVIADELVNGLHHRWIDACMEAMASRQAFLTSQNPLLFDYVTFDSSERVQSSFITCQLDLVDGREQMVWQNMPPEEARIFFEAYEVGIEHVGDILITRGLW
jgi:energy-coupling factor transporter ATP-binding protein EcfA2